MSTVITTIGIFSAIVYGVVYWQGTWILKFFLKPLPVIAMIWWLAAKTKGAYVRWLQVGLFLCAIGDVCLIVRTKTGFLSGLTFFLLAHLVFVVAFLLRNRSFALLRMLPFLAWIVALMLMLWGGLKSMRYPVLVYGIVIGCMMWRAAALFGASDVAKRTAYFAMIGAILFGISDSLIAVIRFGGASRYWGIGIMPFYWGGLWAIMMSGRLREGDKGWKAPKLEEEAAA